MCARGIYIINICDLAGGGRFTRGTMCETQIFGSRTTGRTAEADRQWVPGQDPDRRQNRPFCAGSRRPSSNWTFKFSLQFYGLFVISRLANIPLIRPAPCVCMLCAKHMDCTHRENGGGWGDGEVLRKRLCRPTVIAMSSHLAHHWPMKSSHED